MKTRTAEQERRLGIRWIIVGVLYLAATCTLWWLDVTHNTEGDAGDPWLPPLFTLIFFGLGSYRLHRSHTRQKVV